MKLNKNVQEYKFYPSQPAFKVFSKFILATSLRDRILPERSRFQFMFTFEKVNMCLNYERMQLLEHEIKN